MNKLYPSDQERTLEYTKIFDREKVLKNLVSKNDPIIFDVGANIGETAQEFKNGGDKQIFFALNLKLNAGNLWRN